ncbi:uncharacterized protein LOC142238677 [Haematobia irritans]|uniref:uncharacterized protein LOC142227635 n=1 Tax=Haematobia irritans TaxID=7368 RepID=UPI003F4F4201
MFTSTLGITEKTVRNWVDEIFLNKEQPDKVIPRRKTSIKDKKYEKRHNFLKNWLNDIPKLESHYRRQYTKKLYLQTDFKSFTQIYKLYCEECIKNSDDEVSAVSHLKFMLIIKEQNISLFKPRNDMCDTCVSYEARNITEDQYISHRSEVDAMREEKANDVENAKSGIFLLLCMDMQAVKLIPQTNASASYYKMKLQVHNFTIYNIISHESDNYIWDESEGNLVASTFTTCIIKHLKNCILQSPDINHIIIYSDGCFYQNRNVILSNALISLCINKNITIEHKYLIVGHTQMECDSTHSLIQRKINNKKINLPSQFVEYLNDSRKSPFPLNTHHLTHSYFLDYDSLPKLYSSIRPGKIAGDPTVNMIRALGYDTSGTIYFKTNIKEEYAILPNRKAKDTHDNQPSPLHSQRIKIPKKVGTSPGS